MWGQNEKHREQLSTLQKKAIRVINFKQHNHPIDKLYNTNAIPKIKDYMDLLNCLFVKNIISNESLRVFSKYFKRSYNLHNHTTRQPTHNSVRIYHMNTQSQGYNSVRNKSALHGIVLLTRLK